MNIVSYLFRTLIMKEYFDVIVKQKMSDNIVPIDNMHNQCNGKDKNENG